MSFHYLRGGIDVDGDGSYDGQITINDSLFHRNQTNGQNGDVKNTYDGGAIYIFDGRDGAVFNVNNTTFDSNIAYDDGGAMMIQGTGNPGLTTNITNCTFYNNKAYGLDGEGYSGGAIQFFKNGGSAKMTNTLLSCTFVQNQGGNEGSTIEQKGGAIGLSGAGLFATAAVTRNDCLFIGNTVYDANRQKNDASNYKDISNYTTTQPGSNTQGGSNNVLNVDKGAAPQYTMDDVLGVNNVMLTHNQSSVRAGVDNETVRTIPIKPDGIADNSYAGTTVVPGLDQRNFTRFKDQGAVEHAWVKYDANGGVFSLGTLDQYDGSYYWESNEEGNVTEYYAIHHIDGSFPILDGANDLKAENGNLLLFGWSKDKDARTPDPDYAVGNDFTYTEENTTLYAVWGEVYSVTYQNGGATSGTVPTDGNSPYQEGNPVTVLPQGDLLKDGYSFLGWKASHNDQVYQAGESFTMPAQEVTLTAQWEKNSGPGPGSTYSVTLYKTDSISGQPLEGAEFQLFDQSDKLLGTYETDSNGQIIVKRLSNGAYYFIESKAPEGYIPNDSKHAFTIQNSDRKLHVKNQKEGGIFTEEHHAYVIGYPDKTVRPTRDISRAEVSTVFFRMLQDEVRSTNWSTSNPYPDVSSQYWYNNAISVMNTMGIVKGYPDGSFGPDGSITRAEMAAIAARFVESQGVPIVSSRSFDDIQGHWAENYINTAASVG